MVTYRARLATLDDLDTLVQQRVGMFTDMGVPMDPETMATAYREWLRETLPDGTYRAWVVEHDEDGRRGGIVGGGGLTVLPWPPGPQALGGRIGFVFNIYTEPPHRNRGVGRLVMDTIHGWCREQGIDGVRLNASAEGQPLYTALGYTLVLSPMMQIGLGTRD